ncbi:peptidoglycan-binding protein [Streptomyces sp. NPDC046631]|uniref:peptidoglycan-binding domain-containing protein n=1 Tax=unclassified Streptomyces TaxID=2593676 RepID=UPI0033F87F62
MTKDIEAPPPGGSHRPSRRHCRAPNARNRGRTRGPGAADSPRTSNSRTGRTGPGAADSSPRPHTVDGKFGESADVAVRAVQSCSGLKPDGQIGPQTWKYLDTPLSGCGH